MSQIDHYEARIRYYFNAPRRTHKVMCLGNHIGDVWDDGNITIREDDKSSPAKDEK